MADVLTSTGIVLWGSLFFMILAMIIWDLVWKGIGLWKAARNEHKGWFIAMLLLNTLGILPMIYVFLIAKKK